MTFAVRPLINEQKQKCGQRGCKARPEYLYDLSGGTDNRRFCLQHAREHWRKLRPHLTQMSTDGWELEGE